eukprot:4202596-Lingulodinium_polyedra.AAC.1
MTPSSSSGKGVPAAAEEAELPFGRLRVALPGSFACSAANAARMGSTVSLNWVYPIISMAAFLFSMPFLRV